MKITNRKSLYSLVLIAFISLSAAQSSVIHSAPNPSPSLADIGYNIGKGLDNVAKELPEKVAVLLTKANEDGHNLIRLAQHEAIKIGAITGAAAGSIFVYRGAHNFIDHYLSQNEEQKKANTASWWKGLLNSLAGGSLLVASYLVYKGYWPLNFYMSAMKKTS